MNKEKRVVLILASRILSYPSEDFRLLKQDMEELLEETIGKDSLRENLIQSYAPLCELEATELQKLYVETFDLKSNLGLYLTAHELGDSNRRGAALIKLQKVINQAGFEKDNKELADYIPMLFEFLTVAPKSVEVDRLMKRLAVAVSYMLQHIDRNNPYANILDVLMRYVFKKPTKEEIKQLEDGREKADLEELPYPIMYQ